jgi:chloramphenicol-sensitive protein RarD
MAPGTAPRKGTVGDNQPARSREGLLYGLAAYGFWGLVPLYFKAIAEVPAEEILAHRIVWSALFLAGLLSVWTRWSELARCFRSPAVLGTLLASTVLIAANWYTFIYAVNIGKILQTSLGYFITPLVSIVLGMVFFRERLRAGQCLAVSLATIGVVNLARAGGQLPWSALTLAGSFGLYGLLRKALAVDGLIGLSVETFLLLPVAAGFLLIRALSGTMVWGEMDPATNVLLALSGVVTAVPLLCFGQAARLLRLSTLGFLQYLAPSLAFLLAVFVFREEFDRDQLLCFAAIWTALAIYSVDSVVAYRKRGRQAEPLPLD